MTYAFGPFQLDAHARRLLRDGEPVALADRHLDILLLLVSRAGQVIPKDTLVQTAWKDVAVSDNSLEQAISSLRRTLGAPPPDRRYIETLARRGYRFGAPVTHAAPRLSSDSLDAILAPHRAFLDGRAALETLDRDAVVRAGVVFEQITQASPDYAPAHLGLANALALQFESSRVHSAPGTEALAKAMHHASEACRLSPASGEAWAALGLVSHHSRDFVSAVAAAQRAVSLEPENWRHHLRLAFVSWGEERLRAARRVLQLLPAFPFAHWLAATVYIARQAMAEAEQELTAGAAAQDLQRDATRFSAVGLHLLLGLVRSHAGDEQAALQELQAEIEGEKGGHIYLHEARANAWSAIGAIRLRSQDLDRAITAFEQTLTILPGHAGAIAALAAITPDADRSIAHRRYRERLSELNMRGAHVEAATAEAAFESASGHPERAAAILYAAIEQSPVRSSGWITPIDPVLNVRTNPERWESVLALLRVRAA